MLLRSAESGGYHHTSGQIHEEPAPQCQAPACCPLLAPIWWAPTCPSLRCLLCYTSAELHNSYLNKDGIISAELIVTHSANMASCRTALSQGFGRHRVWHIRAERGQGVPSRLPFPSLCCALERIGPFSYLLQRPKTDLPLQPMGELPEDPRPIAPPCLLQSIRGTRRRWAICLACSSSPHCRPLICTTHLTAGYQTPSRNIQ